jgi:uncharacterized phosphatase
LVRHGETEWNALRMLQGSTDIPLNNTGILQAEECSQFLKNSSWDIIITSPLRRAKQTAKIIKTNINVPFIEMAEFKERHFGDAEGMTKQERRKKYPDKIYPNQEDYSIFSNRIMGGLQKVNEQYKDKKILLVAHGAVINAILTTFSNGEIGSGKTKLINACLSNIHFEKDKWKIKDFNQTSHLSNYSRKGEN